MKILISGGSGFLGRYLTSELIPEHDVLVLGTQESTSHVLSLDRKKIPYIFCDYSLESLSEICKHNKPDSFINLAARRPEANKDTPAGFYCNLMISANIYHACMKHNIQNIVDLSTRMVYDTTEPVLWHENLHVTPGSLYGLSKVWAEQAAQYFNKKGIHIKTLRLAQVIGLGEREGYILQIYLKNAINGLPIKVFGKNLGKRHYVYAKDVVSAIKSALFQKEKSGIYNIGMEQVYSFMELAETINRNFGKQSEILRDTNAPADESVYHMNIEKARTELGWKPQYDLEQTYRDMKTDIEKLNFTL